MKTINDNVVISLCENEAREIYKEVINMSHSPVFGIKPDEILRKLSPLEYHLGFNDYKLKLEGEGYEIY